MSEIEENILGQDLDDGKFTRRQYLVVNTIFGGATLWEAIEAVASTAIEHPEWDMDEEKTWNDWKQELGESNDDDT